MKIHKKIKIGILEICTFSELISTVTESILKLKLKFWGYNEINVGFHLTPKKVPFPVEPWGENVMGASYLYLFPSNNSIWKDTL